MVLKSVRVPDGFEGPFLQAEKYVEKLFGGFERKPEEGAIRVGSERYVLMRCESLYGTWFDALTASFGEDAARDFIYNTAREIGRSDSAEFASRLNLPVGIERLATGPVHFAHAGWALVDILEDSEPAPNSSYFLHYRHPNTFEAEVLLKRGGKVAGCACHFSAGYSAGWCSDAFQLEVHGREIRCTARGDEHCEFIMAVSDKLDVHEARLSG